MQASGDQMVILRLRSGYFSFRLYPRGKPRGILAKKNKKDPNGALKSEINTTASRTYYKTLKIHGINFSNFSIFIRTLSNFSFHGFVIHLHQPKSRPEA